MNDGENPWVKDGENPQTARTSTNSRLFIEVAANDNTSGRPHGQVVVAGELLFRPVSSGSQTQCNIVTLRSKLATRSIRQGHGLADEGVGVRHSATILGCEHAQFITGSSI